MLHDKAYWKPVWTFKKYASQEWYDADMPYEVNVVNGNLLLNGGITLLWQLLSGTGTAFSNANARIGVGDSATAVTAAQTGLQAATNKTFVAMSVTFPTISAQTITFQSAFNGATANYSWQEFTVDNGTTSLNRLVSNQGTKTSGQIWTVSIAITLA